MSAARNKMSGLVRSGEDRKGFLFKSNVILLLVLFMIIFVVPVLPNQREFLVSTLLCILVISGLYAADFSRTAFKILSTTGTLVILATIMNLLFPGIQNLNPLVFLLNTLFFLVVTVALVVHVARAREVDSSALLSAINSYLLIGLSLSILCLILDLIVPGSFAQVNASESGFSTFLYYGFVTLTTLGYGDITPSTELAKSLAAFTALFGQLYLVIIMALIIGKYLKGKKSDE